MSNPGLVRKISNSPSGVSGEIQYDDINLLADDRINTKKNYAINGNFDFWQRSTSRNSTALSGSFLFTADRFRHEWNFGASAVNLTWSRVTDVPTAAQSGFTSTYSTQLVTTARAFPGGLDYFQPFLYKLEGSDFAKLQSKVVTFGFWFKSSVTGVFNFSLIAHPSNRVYNSLFTISTINTWQYFSFSIPMESGVTYNLNNQEAISCYIAPYSTTALQGTQTGSWGVDPVSRIVHNTSTNYLAAGATLNIAQFSISEGVGLGANGFIRAGQTIAQELQLCQRYYQKNFNNNAAVGAYSGGNVAIRFRLPIHMRAGPTLSQISGTTLTGCLDRLGTGIYTPSTISAYLSAWETTSTSISIDFGGTFTQFQPITLATDIVQADAEL